MVKKHSKVLKTIPDNQYQELKELANSYGFSLGGYQSNHGITLYTTEDTVHGESIGELRKGIEILGENRRERILRKAELRRKNETTA